MTKITSLIYLLFGIVTSVVGYAIHHSVVWAIVDYFFAPFAWAKWLICHEVSISLIQEAFSSFLK